MPPLGYEERLKVCTRPFSSELFGDQNSTENNLFLVKRLIQRTGMRNVDPAPKRYTSLAWAAVLGHEETFEFLLIAGHDDDELSKVCVFLDACRLGRYIADMSLTDHCPINSGFGQ